MCHPAWQGPSRREPTSKLGWSTSGSVPARTAGRVQRGPRMVLEHKRHLFRHQTGWHGKNPALISCFPQSAFIKGSKIITSASALSEPIKANRVMSKAVVHPPLLWLPFHIHGTTESSGCCFWSAAKLLPRLPSLVPLLPSSLKPVPLRSWASRPLSFHPMRASRCLHRAT